jgi:hypothetical protein
VVTSLLRSTGGVVDGYQAIIDEIRSLGTDTVSAGDETGQVDLAGTVGEVGAAVPGGEVGAAAGALRTAWERRVHTLGGEVEALGGKLVDSAEEYATNEAAAEANLRDVDPRYRRYE